jgi:hypothetical protein
VKALGATTASFLCALVLAPLAEAAQRYTAPAGAGEVCSKEVPCSLKQAIVKAKAGDEVIVNPGTYTVSDPLQTPEGVANISIHGEPGGPMPVIAASTSTTYTVEFRGAGGRLSYLALADTAPSLARGVECRAGGLVERVMISVSSERALGLVQVEGCEVRDSLILADGSKSQAILATGSKSGSSGVLRNVTALATGPETSGITSSFSYTGEPGAFTLNARNVIASGDGEDLHSAGGAFGVGHFLISNSNFESTRLEPGSTVEGNSNQTAAPIFVNAAGGNYREAPGSPTIDAGAVDQLGPLDLDGNPRTLGAAPDIGAYEFPSPAIAPVAAQIQSLALAPSAFRAAPKGGAVLSRRKKASVGTTVTYALSAAGNAEFTVERRLSGRMTNGRCAKKTAANADKKRCALFKPLKPTFTHSGAGGRSSFRFSGRLGSKALKPGAYRLLGSAGGAVKRAAFRMVK